MLYCLSPTQMFNQQTFECWLKVPPEGENCFIEDTFKVKTSMKNFPTKTELKKKLTNNGNEVLVIDDPILPLLRDNRLALMRRSHIFSVLFSTFWRRFQFYAFAVLTFRRFDLSAFLVADS